MPSSGSALFKEEKSRRVTEALPATPIQIEMIPDILPQAPANVFRNKPTIEAFDQKLPQEHAGGVLNLWLRRFPSFNRQPKRAAHRTETAYHIGNFVSEAPLDYFFHHGNHERLGAEEVGKLCLRNESQYCGIVNTSRKPIDETTSIVVAREQTVSSTG